jgi:hypothetical protein
MIVGGSAGPRFLSPDNACCYHPKTYFPPCDTPLYECTKRSAEKVHTAYCTDPDCPYIRYGVFDIIIPRLAEKGTAEALKRSGHDQRKYDDLKKSCTVIRCPTCSVFPEGMCFLLSDTCCSIDSTVSSIYPSKEVIEGNMKIVKEKLVASAKKRLAKMTQLKKKHDAAKKTHEEQHK